MILTMNLIIYQQNIKSHILTFIVNTNDSLDHMVEVNEENNFNKGKIFPEVCINCIIL